MLTSLCPADFANELRFAPLILRIQANFLLFFTTRVMADSRVPFMKVMASIIMARSSAEKEE